MKCKFLYIIVFTALIFPFSFQVAAAELCDGSGMFNPGEPLMDEEKPKPEGEEEAEPDCDD